MLEAASFEICWMEDVTARRGLTPRGLCPRAAPLLAVREDEAERVNRITAGCNKRRDTRPERRRSTKAGRHPRKRSIRVDR
jgi:hypothetical protein